MIKWTKRKARELKNRAVSRVEEWVGLDEYKEVVLLLSVRLNKLEEEVYLISNKGGTGVLDKLRERVEDAGSVSDLASQLDDVIGRLDTVEGDVDNLESDMEDKLDEYKIEEYVRCDDLTDAVVDALIEKLKG
jgi:hypothetical protein